MINWYNEVSRNLDKIPDCVAYFEKELLEAKKQCKIYGNLEKASAALPGIVEERFSQLQQLEAILEYLNIELRRLRSKTFRKYLENYIKDKYPDEPLVSVQLWRADRFEGWTLKFRKS